ncbi:MAG: aldehyde ferredoxin oxidoreductase family protein [Candidatus Bathyarchaeia archaeon]
MGGSLVDENVPGGYNGKILRADLSKGRVKVENIDDAFCRKYLGGSGFVTYFLLKELQPRIDPLSPENKLIFAVGPVTGTSILGAARFSAGAKSPLSGGIAWSQAGGFWGVELKRAGYDTIIIEGKADKPVYLWICDEEAEIRSATHIWGQKTKETQQIIREEIGDKSVRVIMIGPAGERLVRFACIMDGTHDAAARGGLGAVMGSKNLKAIALRGHKSPSLADPERVKELTKWMVDSLYKDWMTKANHEYGTGGPVHEGMEEIGALPVKNWREGKFPGWGKIHAGVIKDTMRVGMEGCWGCPVRCKKVCKFDDPYPHDPAYGGPEYETLASFGCNCGIDNLKAIVKANELCNAYGLDTISTGSVIAFAMECFEKGLISIEDTDGIELKFGNDEALLKCIELIAKRQGFGNQLAEGTARLAKKIGGEAEKIAIHVKGIDLGYHEPRLWPSVGLGFMINPHGADHVCNAHLATTELTPEDVILFKAEQSRQLILDCMVMCHFFTLMIGATAGAKEQATMAEIIAAVTGWKISMVELERIAERIFTMARLFNIREGFTSEDDNLPPRFFQPKIDGSLFGRALDPDKMEKAKRYYYMIMGWNEKGIPLSEKIQELDIQ